MKAKEILELSPVLEAWATKLGTSCSLEEDYASKHQGTMRVDRSGMQAMVKSLKDVAQLLRIHALCLASNQGTIIMEES